MIGDKRPVWEKSYLKNNPNSSCTWTLNVDEMLRGNMNNNFTTNIDLVEAIVNEIKGNNSREIIDLDESEYEIIE